MEDYMDDDPAATPAQESVATGEGFRGAAEAAEPTPKPAVTQEGAATGEGTEESKVPGTWEDLEQTEWFPTAFEEKRAAFLDEQRPEILREAKSAAMREFDPSHQRAEASLGDIAKNGQTMARSLRDVIETIGDTGGDAKTMGRAIQRVIDDNPGFIEMVNSSMHSTGMDAALRRLADESGDPNLLPDVYLRLKNDPGMGDKGFAREFLDRLTEARMGGKVKEAVEKATKPKDEEIVRLTAELNRLKGQDRESGPTKLEGSAGGGKNYLAMTAEERGKLTNEERDRLTATQ